MDKLKKVFSPGSKKDDEVLYGDSDARRESATGNVSQREPEQLHAVEGSDKKERSILNQVLNPGGDKYDDQRYGTTATTKEPELDPNRLHTHPEAEKQDHSITRQILNPNNAKYDEQRFGETATTGGDRKSSVPTTEAPPVVGADTQLQTDPGKKDHSILRQVLNPHGDKYDEQGYGSTAHAAGDMEPQALRSDPVANPDSSIKRQILNPGQEKYDPTIYGSGQPTAGAATTSTSVPSQGAGSTEQSLPDRTAATGDDSNLGRDAALAAGGVGAAGAGAYATHRYNEQPRQEQSKPDPAAQTLINQDPNVAKTVPAATTATTTTTTTTSQPSAVPTQVAGTSQPPPDQAHHGRDAALAGAGIAAAGGAGYYAANRDNPDDKITERPHPLSDRANDAYTGTDSTVSGPHAVGPAGGAHINPVGAPEESLTSGTSNIERDTVIGAGAAGTTGAAASTQINSAPSDVQDATYTERAYPVGGGYHHTTGPHQTDIANVLDPHVPGEFPSEDGTDKHDLNNVPLGPVTARDDGPTTSTASDTTATSDTTRAGEKGIVGTIASAVGLGGLVGAASSKEKSDPAVEPAQSTSAATHPGGESYPIQTTTNTLASAPVESQGTSGISTGEKSGEHHYGRDAGIAAGAAGAGAAGYGMYEATKDRDTSGATAGAVSQPSQQSAPANTTTTTTTTTTATSKAAAVHEPTTSGTADARSKPEPEKGEHHYGRDAALAGGAGAAGYGVYEATKDRDETGPASKTIGPHESNVANIVDPRVQPEPEKMKESQTVGPYSSDLANKADPRVEPDPTKAREETRSRDAAVAGGAATAGAGAVAATRYEDTTAGRTPVTSNTVSTANEPPLVASQKSREEEAQQQGGHTVYILGQPTSQKPNDPVGSVEDTKEEKKAKKSRDDDSERSNDKGEKKHGLLHKILHPGRKDKEEKEEKEARRSVEQQHPPASGSLNHPLVTSEDLENRDPASTGDNRVSTDERGHNKLHKKSVEQPHSGGETVIEPHTGLPMNVGKYGQGAGGTDGAQQISGYHETDPAIRGASVGTAENAGTKGPSHQPGEEGVAGPDWEAIKKANTPY